MNPKNKFLVLYRTIVFFDAVASDDHELVLQCDVCETIEESIVRYNQLVSDPVNQQVMILQPIKSFDRQR